MEKFDFAVEALDGEEKVLTVEYAVVGRYWPATRYEPEELPEVEVVSIEWPAGTFELPAGTMDAIQEKAEEKAEEARQNEFDARADYEYERRRDADLETTII